MKYVIHFLFLISAISTSAQENTSGYYYSIDLNKVIEDRLKVTLLTPKIRSNETIFRLPKMIPGTYAIYDFGRYISDFKAFDKKGTELMVHQESANSWKIFGAKKLGRIIYLVDDSWDSSEIKGPEIFQPAGTNIEEGKMFLINNGGFFGYFDDQKNIPFKLTVTKPPGFYGSTALSVNHLNAKIDQYIVRDYAGLIDAPIMYSKPDTTVLHIGETEILVSLYSPNHKATSARIAKELKKTLVAQQEYLGGRLPVDKYAFIVSLTDDPDIKSYGALEHSYSSCYFLPEDFNPEKLAQTIRKTGSHEFFHIITPLNIHSEEIGNFDYNHPKMSAHLWMYEGLTEYAAYHMQIKYGLMNFKDYLKSQTEKLNGYLLYNDTLAFTRMSKGVLDTFKNEYPNVYQKGALIGLCLDIKLRGLSNGKYGTQNLMKDLSGIYGKTKSFKDEELISTITKLTFPEIGAFLNNYVAGDKKLPYKEIFASIGVDFQDAVFVDKATIGGMHFGYKTNDNTLCVEDTVMDSYGKKLGIRKDDIILAINDIKIPELSKISTLLDSLKQASKPEGTFSILVQRKDNNGILSKVKLSQPAGFLKIKRFNDLTEFPILTEAQQKLRAAWLSIN